MFVNPDNGLGPCPNGHTTLLRRRYNVDIPSRRRIDVVSTSKQRSVPIGTCNDRTATLNLFCCIAWVHAWTLNATSMQRTKSFEMKIKGVTGRVRNTVIQEWLGWTQDIIARIWQRRLQYFGHVVRIEQGRYSKLA